MKIKSIVSILGALGVASFVTGCATVTEAQVEKRYTDTSSKLEDQVNAQKNKPSEPLVKKVKGSYLGSSPVALSYDATLPIIFRDVILQFPGKMNLATAARKITAATNIPVRIRDDVYYTAKSLQTGSMAQNTLNATLPGIELKNPLPGDTAGLKNLSNNSGISGEKFGDFDTTVEMDFKGSLSNYLDSICNPMGINWEYREGTIYIYRLATKVFQVKVNPGDVNFSSKLEKGGSTSTGATGSGGSGSTNGSFTSQTGASSGGKYSVWETLETAIKGMLSPVGKVTVAQSSGDIIVTDTKEVLNEVGRLIDTENAVLTRQVQVDVRIVRVSVNNSSNAALNINAVYSKLAANHTNWSYGMSAPGNLVDPSGVTSGSMGFNILSPTSRFAGSSIVVDALNQIGKVVSDKTTTAITTNRRPVPVGKFSTVTYLAQTTPASGGASGSSGGVPGLTPGQVTTGFFLNMIPTVLDNNSILMSLSLDQSSLTKMGSITTGSGETLQMIQTPNTDGDKSDHSIGLREGESLVLMGVATDTVQYDKTYAVSGYSNLGSNTQEMQVIIVTPKVRAGI